MKGILGLSALPIFTLFLLVSCGDSGSDSSPVSDTPQFYDVTISKSPSDGGSISPSADSSYEEGSLVNLQASPTDAYMFTGWSGTIDTAANPVSIIVDKNYSLTANFVLKIKEVFGGSNYDQARFITEASDGGYILTGQSTSNDGDFSGLNNGMADIFVFKVDSYGKKQWIETIGGSDEERAYSVNNTSDGGYIITGSFKSNDGDFSGLNNGYYDVFLLKMDSDGNHEWLKTIGGSGDETGISLSPTNDGGYIVTGYSDSNDGDFSGLNSGNSDCFILKVDSNGNRQWLKTVGGSENDTGQSLTPTSDGGYLIAGTFISDDGDFNGLNMNSVDAFILKIDSDGNREWIQTVAGRRYDSAISVIQTSDSGYLIGGNSDSNVGDFSGLNRGNYDGYVLKLDANGNKQWLKIVGATGRDFVRSVTIASDGGYVVAGHSDSNDSDFYELNNGMEDIYILKLDSNGNQQWLKTVGGSGSDAAISMVKTSDERYLITGSSESNDGDFSGLNKGSFDIFIIKK